jgi:hypothetical protein
MARDIGSRWGRQSARNAMTMAEIIIVVVIIVVIAGLLLPSINTSAGGPQRKVSCGNNQRQIVLAMGVYSNENDGIWPCRPTTTTGAFDAATHPSSPWATTVGTFEFVVVQTGNQMTSKVFACLSTLNQHPKMNSANASLDETGNTISHWVSQLNGDPSSQFMPSYCYDWSVPSNAKANRAVTADRSFDHCGHQAVTIVCYADNHVDNLKKDASQGPQGLHITNPVDQVPSASIYSNPDAFGPVADNIYDDNGDGPGGLTIGGGSTTRAWIK